LQLVLQCLLRRRWPTSAAAIIARSAISSDSEANVISVMVPYWVHAPRLRTQPLMLSKQPDENDRQAEEHISESDCLCFAHPRLLPPRGNACAKRYRQRKDQILTPVWRKMVQTTLHNRVKGRRQWLTS